MKVSFGKPLLATCVWLSSLLFSAYAQQLTLNPQSYYGIGDVVFPSSPRNAGMGGTGVASTSFFTVNQINPATWADLSLSSLDVSGFGNISRFRNNTQAETQGTGSFQNAGMAFPGNKKIVFALGFAPYSVMGYNVSITQRPFADTNLTQTSVYKGSGGLNRVYGGLAGKLWHKRILWGLNYTFNFGETNHAVATTLSSSINTQSGIRELSVYMHGSGVQAGLIFTDTLNKKAFKALPIKDQKFPLKLRVGFTADYTSGLKGNMLDINTGVTTSGNNYVTTFTNTHIDSSGKVIIPLRAGAGFELSRPGKFAFAVDGFWQDWSTYSSYGKKDAAFGSYLGINAGVEWIPDIFSSSYVQRIAWRGGAYFHQLPLTYNGSQVNDFGITLGVGVPPARGTSSVNVALALGKRGSLAQNQPIEEYYARIQVGVTISERWFIKRVVD